MITPLTFSSTLELLLAFFVVLSLNKPATNIHASKINLVEAQQHENAPIIDISLDADIDPLIPIPQEEQRIIQLFEHPLKLIIAIFVFICVIVLSLACIIVKTVASFHDETHIRESWYFMYDILKITSVFVSCMVTGSLWYKYRKLIPENRRILIRAVKVNWPIIGSVFNSIFGFLKSQELDLLLLKITLIISVIAGCTSMFFELWGFLDSENYPLMQFLFWILPNVLSLTSFYLNVKLLNILLAIDERILIATSKNKFTFFMAIYQMTKNFIRAIMYVIIFLDHKVPHEPRSDFLDEIMLSTQSLYPFKPSMNIFSALCWAHFIQNFCFQIMPLLTDMINKNNF